MTAMLLLIAGLNRIVNTFNLMLQLHNSSCLFLQMNEIEVCPECYLAACQKRENWFCEPCVSKKGRGGY